MIEFNYNIRTDKLQLKCDAALFEVIREHFSIDNPNAKFLRRRNRFIPLRKYAITPTGICELGLFWEIKSFLNTKYPHLHIQIAPDLDKKIKVHEIKSVIKNLALDLRDYQEEVVLRALRVGRGTCILGTGAGKTLTTATIVENIYNNCRNKNIFKCLILVPDLGLVEQTYNEFISYGVTFSLTKWTGSNTPDETANVVICNAGILQSRFEETEWVRYIDLLIVDECHKIKHDNKISKIISKIKAEFKFGFTGTLPEDNFDKWSIIGRLGPVIYEKNSYSLRLENYLTNAEVKILELAHNCTIPRVTGNEYRDELDFIYSCNKRNSFIKALCMRIPNNTLILVNHIKHGEELLNVLTCDDSPYEVFFIRGEVDIEEREKIKRIMEAKNNIVCIAISAIFSTGVNIKNLHNIVFAAGGKSFIRTVQSIGRGLRLHDNKEKLLIFDISDKLPYSTKHSLKRREIYEKEKIKFNIKQFNIT